MLLHIFAVTVLSVGVSCYQIRSPVRRAPGSITCRSCLDVQWPEKCTHKTTCGNNQTCFTQEYIDVYGRRAYRLGCQSRDVCQKNYQASLGPIGRRRRQNSNRMCYRCCDKEDCNWKMCHAFGWPTTFLAVSPTPPPLGPLGCNFNWDTCNWHQVKTDQFDWRRTLRYTSTLGTGPSSDHTTKTGYYLYIESSAPHHLGDKAQIRTPKVNYGREMCFTFWYNMYGRDVGSLTLDIQTLNGTTTLWTKTGNQGHGWFPASVNLSKDPFTLTISAVFGGGYQGDIAIDDLSSTFGKCVS